MIAMNEKANRSKLLAAIAVLALVVCAFAVILPSGDVSAEPTYTDDGATAEVATAEDFNAALDNADVSTIKLTESITVNEVISIERDLTIVGDGNDITITANSGSTWSGNPGKSLIYIHKCDVTIDNIKFDSANAAYGINVWDDAEPADGVFETNVTLTDVSSVNSVGAGLTINKSAVTVENIVTSGNGWGSINVDSDGTLAITGSENDLGDAFQVWSETASKITSEDSNFQFETYNWGKAENPTGTILIQNGTITNDFVLPSTDYLVIPAGKTLEIAEGATFTNSGNIVNNGTVDNQGTFTNNATIDNKGNLLGNELEGTGTISYNDGTMMTIGEYVYNIFVDTMTLQDKSVVTFAYGIMVPAITYDGQPVEVQDVEPEVIPLDVSVEGTTTTVKAYSATFDATLSSIIPEENDGSTGDYQMRVAVNLIAESGEQKVNKYVYNIVDFVVEGAEPTIDDLAMEGWNVNIPGDYENSVPTFTYTGIAGEIYTEEDFPGEVEYTLTLGDEVFTQDRWDEITTAGEYTLTAKFPAVGNNKATEATCTVTITDGPEVSPFEPGDVEDKYVDDLFGMSVSDIQGQIEFSAVDGKENTIVATGMVRYVDSFVGFWGAEADKPGYYLAFTVNEGMNIDWSKVTLTLTGDDTKVFGPDAANGALTDGTFILYIGNPNFEGGETFTAEFTFTIDIDGEAPLYTEATYTLVTSVEGDDSVGLEPFTYIIEFVDSQNNVVLTDNAADGDYYQIPYAGAGVGFNGWNTEVVEGDAPRNYNFASVMVVSKELDVNNDGKITLTATYGETPVDPVGPSDPATTVYPGIVKGDEVIITLVGETETGYGYIPAGTLTIEYTAVEWTDFGGQMVPMPKTYELTVDVTEGQMAVHISADQFQSFENIIGINVTYTSIDGGLTGYNSAIYNVTLTAPTNE